jgi:hypothetical protein
MSRFQRRAVRRAGLALLVAGPLGLAAAAGPAAADEPEHASKPLVVRGTDTVREGACDATGCDFTLAGGSARGTVAGAYKGGFHLDLPRAFPNGEGGLCAPVRGRIVLGAGTPDRLVLALAGDSCQDGAGDPQAASFTGLSHFTVKRGTGAYAGVHGSGLQTSVEDAADQERMTLIGRLSR